ncbi:MAG: sulfatase [Planctomycetota bacterium]
MIVQVAAAARFAGLGDVTDDAPPPNVLFIAIDDLRPDLGCYGVPHARSPRLDAFADTAMVFEQHYVQAPSCGPSRAALLTGRDPARSGRLGNASLYGGKRALSREALDGAQTMPELFRRNGYRTVCIGKISHTPDGRVFAYDGSGDGRDELPNAWDVLATPFGPWERGWGAFFAYAGGRHREDGTGARSVFEFIAETDDALPDGLMARAATEQLKDLAERDGPFFLGVGFFKPHLPFVATRADRAALEGVEVPPPPWPEPLEGPYDSRSGEFMGYRGAGEDAVEARRAYLACVRYVDRQVGVVLGALEETGLAKNTIVVVWGDHGWHLGDSGIWGKHTLLDRSLRSVLMVRAPGVTRAGSRTASLVATLDLYPTLVDLCGLEDRRTSHELDGVSLRPLLDGTAPSVRDAVTARWGKAATVRTGTHRLLARRRDGEWRDVRLYLTADGPDPITDRSNAEPKTVEALLERLER